MFVKCLILLCFAAFIEAQLPHYYSASCPPLRLDHGRVRTRPKTRLVKFMCLGRYELVGNRYATCRNGKWDAPVPVCVKNGVGCRDLPRPKNALQMKAHHDAWVITMCLPGYKLVGSSAIYCNGFRWNASSPTCVDSSENIKLSCDFEDPGLCGWEQDELHDFDWRRMNKNTPSSFMNTGPTYDHTLGVGKSGYYMYIESTSRLENESARLLSPVYPKSLSTSGCFSFFYHMYGQGIGGLKVYQKPDTLRLNDLLNMTEVEKQKYILFEQWGNLGDFWYSAAPQMVSFDEDFQIVIEGIRGTSFTSDIAIDDVAIRQGINCTYFRAAATSPSPIYSETCEGRCELDRLTEPHLGCGCSASCLTGSNRCCADFMELCIFGSNSQGSTEPDEVSTSDEQPQTEKLIGETTSVTSPTPTIHQSIPTRRTTANPTTPKIMPTKPADKTTATPAPTIPTSPKPTSPKPTSAKPTTAKPTTITNPPTKPTPMPTTPNKTKKVEKTTQRVTWLPNPTTAKTTPVLKTTTGQGDARKRQRVIDLQKLVQEQPVQAKSSTWMTTVITIVVLSVFASLVYLGIASRTSRGRVVLARLRNRVSSSSNDSEVRYLNSTDDDL